MRFPPVAAAVCLSLCAVAGIAAPPAPQRADTPTAAAPAAAAPAAGSPAASPPSDAAAKHAKRTACLKDARTKKLVGAERPRS